MKSWELDQPGLAKGFALLRMTERRAINCLTTVDGAPPKVVTIEAE